MKITIVGAGNSGLVHAVKLSEKGHDIFLMEPFIGIHDDVLKNIRNRGGIDAIDASADNNEFFAYLDIADKDIASAVGNSDIVFIMTQTLQHEEVARIIGPYLKDNQIIVLIPGYMGSIYFARHVKARAIFSEAETTVYNGRIISPTKVKVSFANVRTAFSVLGTGKTPAVVKRLGEIFGMRMYSRKNIIESALHNPNLIVHTVGAIMSASRIEYSRGEFWMYREAFTESIWRLIGKLDSEKNDILAAFSCEKLDYIDAAKWRNEKDLSRKSLEVFNAFAAVSSKGPASLNTRYLYEDVPMGLCLMHSLGQSVNIETPICDSLVNIASALLDTDFWQQGRTLESLGIPGLTGEALLNYMESI